MSKYFYGRKGKLYQTYYDGMEEQLNAMGLVTNAIIYWNSLYLEKVFEQMKKKDMIVQKKCYENNLL